MSKHEEESKVTEEQERISEGQDISAESDSSVSDDSAFLLPRDILLSAGIHIGTRTKTKHMEKFIYRVRPDGLFVLDLKKTDEQIRVAAKFLSRFDPAKITVVASRLYAQEPVTRFCEITGANPIVKRFIPGLLSNKLYPDRIEPDVLIVSDPNADSQAVKEASLMGLPLIALCSTDNDFSGIDLVIPTNNKGRRSLAVIYWLLARQILRERGELPLDKDLPLSIDDFEAKIVKEEI